MVVLTGSPPTLLLPTKLLTFPSKSKSTLCWEGTNNGSHTNQSNPNSTPTAKVHAKVFPKGNVIVASKEDDDKTDAPAAPTKKMPQHPNMISAKYDGVYDMFRGRLDESGFVFQQNFAIRSYELGPDGKETMTCLMERLQETSVQHCRSIGLLVGGFGSSLEMSKRGQVWVVRKLQAIVDKYPSW
ncbi:palmitoyl-acyl carrier protein thioesterase, chloroplastic-like isoform X1 [Malus sylvestris]|uniref:palmitoyl-acyl carrier protein thioesterase, chloroplastic-like isoform X1 n=1 Tax=Malus sylvestris TaxID=3752 RepID=UPI0021AC8D1B|nr:palmitoyl-acyl carrier protein thioesterase, chloroplastic-like isoform X1 [Malus sylvestris]